MGTYPYKLSRRNAFRDTFVMIHWKRLAVSWITIYIYGNITQQLIINSDNVGLDIFQLFLVSSAWKEVEVDIFITLLSLISFLWWKIETKDKWLNTVYWSCLVPLLSSCGVTLLLLGVKPNLLVTFRFQFFVWDVWDHRETLF